MSTLYTSVASISMLLWCTETELSFAKSSSKLERLSLQIIRKQHSWSQLTLLFTELELNIQTTGQ